ncbi:DUF3313 domain-containing protein [Pseudomonas sp. NPDC086251]|uniref:DUF3313 domain-containing protein n=1 Tax=Pseudomonas sp. NPDC086251 TaxID=3364431 RepID=UPI003836698A
MNLFRKVCAVMVMGSVLLSGCVSTVTPNTQFSGYFDSYRELKPAQSPSGQPVLRWVAPGFNPHRYSTVVFDYLDIYPLPKATDRIDLQTFDRLQNEASESARNALSQHYRVVDSLNAVPVGSKTLILYAAITGVGAENQGMQWYEAMPLAAVVGGVAAATGHRSQHSELYIEAFLVDAETHLPVAKVVRKVFGRDLNNSEAPITADDFTVAINAVTGDLGAFLR